jgi:Flp pilus assembly protein TadG
MEYFLMNTIKHLISNSKGQAIIEFILVVMIFCVLLYGIIDLAQIGIIKHTLDSACREGARAASAIPDLKDNDAVVLSRVRKTLIDGKVFTNSRVNKPIPTPEIRFIRGDALAAGTAQNGDMVVVRTQIEYRVVFSHLTGKTITIAGEAISKYLL